MRSRASLRPWARLLRLLPPANRQVFLANRAAADLPDPLRRLFDLPPQKLSEGPCVNICFQRVVSYSSAWRKPGAQ